jgi:tRNA threonylcarbamoyladenosine biosynthesis protein TsaE
MKTDGRWAFTCSAPETMSCLADALAAALHPGDTVLLQGELGAGKTTLAQYLARSLGVGEDQYVASPSFALLHEYHGRLPLYHMDLYRLGDEEDVEAAGLADYLEERGVCLIEWPNRLGSLTPADRLEIRIAFLPDGARLLTLIPHGESWRNRLIRVAAQIAAAEHY